MTRIPAIASTLAVVTVLGMLAPAALAQDGGSSSLQGASGATARPRPRPRIDPLTALIRGRITSDTGAPLRRAEVRVMANGSVTRLATTDSDGRYELRDLPAGTFTLTAARTGFVPLKFGQRRPSEAPVPIMLAEGARFTADVALPRGGAIAGRVFDERGEPMADVRVQALRSRVVQGRRRLQAVGAGDRTDDTGSFRVFGLAPGDYYIAASGFGPEQQPGSAIKASVPTYYPGTPVLEEAQRITLGVGAEASADVQLLAVRTARVAGVVLDSSGAPTEAMVNLASDAVGLGYSDAMGSMPLTISGHADTAADGSFVLSDVPPGTYTLQASVFGRAGRTARAVSDPMTDGHEAVSISIVVGSSDVVGLTLTTGTGGSLNGRLERDAGVTRPLPAGLGVEARQTQPFGMSMRRTGPNGEFSVAGMMGPFQLHVEGLPEGWAVKAITLNGVDVTDSPIDLKGARNADARIVLTDRVTGLTGVITAKDAARKSVVIFPEDAARWTYPSRYIRTVRTDDEGVFMVSGLPGGTRYRALAVESLDDGDGEDPEFLERMRERATSFSLDEGERKTVELRDIQR